jgi:hypothetical protein
MAVTIYLVRHEGGEPVGIYWADGLFDLFDRIDESDDPTDCEYRILNGSGGYHFDYCLTGEWGLTAGAGGRWRKLRMGTLERWGAHA